MADDLLRNLLLEARTDNNTALIATDYLEENYGGLSVVDHYWIIIKKALGKETYQRWWNGPIGENLSDEDTGHLEDDDEWWELNRMVLFIGYGLNKIKSILEKRTTDATMPKKDIKSLRLKYHKK